MKPKLTKEQLNEQEKEMKKKVRNQVRDIERAITRLEQQTKKAEGELKKAAAAKKDRQVLVIYAKNVKEAQKAKEKQLILKGKVQGIEHLLTCTFANLRMGNIVSDAGVLMKEINKLTNVGELTQAMTEMAMGLDKLGITNELADDALDGVMYDDVKEDENVDQLIEELTKPNNKVGPQMDFNKLAGTGKQQEEDTLDSLEAKLQNLKS